MRWSSLLLLPLLVSHGQTFDNDAFFNHLQTFGGIHASGPVQTTPEMVGQLVEELGAGFQAPLTLRDLAKRLNAHAPVTSSQRGGIEQIHLALTSDPRQMRVVFACTTSTNTTTATVLLSDGRNFTATPYTYHVPSRWWQPNGWLGHLYTVVFDELAYNQAYSYSLHLNDVLHLTTTATTAIANR